MQEVSLSGSAPQSSSSRHYLSAGIASSNPCKRSLVALWNEPDTAIRREFADESVNVCDASGVLFLTFRSVPTDPALTLGRIFNFLKSLEQYIEQPVECVVFNLSSLSWLTLGFCGEVFLAEQELRKMDKKTLVLLGPTGPRMQPALTNQIRQKIPLCFVIHQPGTAELIRPIIL